MAAKRAREDVAKERLKEYERFRAEEFRLKFKVLGAPTDPKPPSVGCWVIETPTELHDRGATEGRGQPSGPEVSNGNRIKPMHSSSSLPSVLGGLEGGGGAAREHGRQEQAKLGHSKSATRIVKFSKARKTSEGMLRLLRTVKANEQKTTRAAVSKTLERDPTHTYSVHPSQTDFNGVALYRKRHAPSFRKGQKTIETTKLKLIVMPSAKNKRRLKSFRYSRPMSTTQQEQTRKVLDQYAELRGGKASYFGVEDSSGAIGDEAPRRTGHKVPAPETTNADLMCPSFLPLDIFFDPEKERNKAVRAAAEDDKRLELLEAHRDVRGGLRGASLGRGKSRWYNTDGSFFWKACEIIFLDKSSRRYLIEWVGGGRGEAEAEGKDADYHVERSRKFVSRFNLVFDGETKDDIDLTFREAK